MRTPVFVLIVHILHISSGIDGSGPISISCRVSRASVQNGFHGFAFLLSLHMDDSVYIQTCYVHTANKK